MARIQSLTQEHALARSIAPTSSRFITGAVSAGGGVPKMHPLKSSFPVLKAASLMKGLRMRKLATLKPLSMRMPSLKMPRL